MNHADFNLSWSHFSETNSSKNKSAFYFYLPDVWSSRADWFLHFETIILSLTVRQKGAKNGGGGNGDAADLSSNPLIRVMGLTAEGPPQSEQSD